MRSVPTNTRLSDADQEPAGAQTGTITPSDHSRAILQILKHLFHAGPDRS